MATPNRRCVVSTLTFEARTATLVSTLGEVRTWTHTQPLLSVWTMPRSTPGTALGVTTEVPFLHRRHRRRPDGSVPATTRFERDAGAAGVAREFTRAALHEWRQDALASDVELIVSEFVTQCLANGSGGTISLHRNRNRLHIEVTSDAAFSDVPAVPSIALTLVEAASTEWGVNYTWPHFRAVWSNIALQ